MKQKGLSSEGSNKVNSAFDDKSVNTLNKIPGGNERRSSGRDRGTYKGSHDISPSGCGEFDSVINENDLG